MSEPTRIFVLLSGPDPVRYSILDAAVRAEFTPEEKVVVLAPASEADEASAALAGLPQSIVGTWSLGDGRVFLPEPGEASRTDSWIILHGGGVSPIELLEALAGWLRKRNEFELGRITVLVDCGLAARSREALAWYEACVVFADLVWLGNREEAGEKWVRDFELKHEKLRFPALFDLIKKERPRSPVLFFDTEPRRLAHLFDPADDLAAVAEPVVLEEGEPEEGDEEDEPEAPEAAYLRWEAGGRRENPVPPWPEPEKG